jgi:hypothetical protein
VEPILNELSVEPVADTPADARMLALVGALRALRALGATRVLRSTQDALEREVATGISMRAWLFLGAGYREEKQFLRSALNKAPFVEALLERAEVEQGYPIEVQFHDQRAVGLAAALLLQSTSLSLVGRPDFTQAQILVKVSTIDDAGDLRTADEHVPNVWDEASVEQAREALTERVLGAVPDGAVAWARRADLFGQLDWSREAQTHLCALGGSEVAFAEVIHSLVLLSRAAAAWTGGPFEPPMRFSVESGSTLRHPHLGRLRDCTSPTGIVTRLSLHLKLHSGWRIYYSFQETEIADGNGGRSGRAMVGYLGPHLPIASEQ